MSFIGWKLAEFGQKKRMKTFFRWGKLNLDFCVNNFIYTFRLRIFFSRCRDNYLSSLSLSQCIRNQDKRQIISWTLLSSLINCAVGEHFSLLGHSIDNLRVIILEKVKLKEQYRKESEKYFIRKFDTYYNGMNKNQGG